MRICEVKDCNTPVFGTCKISRKGYCKRHQSLREDFDKRSLTQKAISKINKNKTNALSNKVKSFAKGEDAFRDGGKTELDKWFKDVAAIIETNPHCWNCGEWISPKYYRHASAHIFPKAIFESVATHPLNFLVLGAGCGCHHEFDSSIDKASKMQVWKTAVLRFVGFEKDIKETHKYLQLFKDKI